jgi:hypothetical protein
LASILPRHDNPEVITQYNIVPGLMGVVLTIGVKRHRETLD